MKRKILTTILALIFLSAIVIPTVLAEENTFEIVGTGISITDAGDFAFLPANGTITLGSDITFGSAASNMAVTDPSGTNSGWILSFGMSDFYAEVDDPIFAAATQVLDIYVPAYQWVTYALADENGAITTDIVAPNFFSSILLSGVVPEESIGAPIPGDEITFYENSSSTAPAIGFYDSGNGTASSTMVEVEPGYGAGAYVFDFDFSIVIDEWLPTGTQIDSRDTTLAAAETIANDPDSGGRFAFMDGATFDGTVEKIQVFEGTYYNTFTYGIASNPTT